MSNFYTAVEGKTFRGLPVYKFAGKREAMIDRSECDFDGCEFVARYDEDSIYGTVTLLPESVTMMREKMSDHLWHYLIDSPSDIAPADGLTFYAGEFEWELGTSADDDELQLDWPFGVPTDA